MRHGIYQLIKDAYRVRSTYFHGNSFEKYTNVRLLSISKGIDDLARNVLNRALDQDAAIFLQSRELLEMSFRDLLFEDERKPDGTTFESGVEHLRFNQQRNSI